MQSRLSINIRRDEQIKEKTKPKKKTNKQKTNSPLTTQERPAGTRGNAEPIELFDVRITRIKPKKKPFRGENNEKKKFFKNSGGFLGAPLDDGTMFLLRRAHRRTIIILFEGTQRT